MCLAIKFLCISLVPVNIDKRRDCNQAVAISISPNSVLNGVELAPSGPEASNRSSASSLAVSVEKNFMNGEYATISIFALASWTKWANIAPFPSTLISA